MRLGPTVVAAVAAVALAAGSAASAGIGSFTDVDDTDWYADAVAWMTDEGITTGTRPGCFEPDGIVSRGQAVVILHRLAGSPTPTGELRFIDVEQGWQIDAVRWADANGVTTGVTPTTFEPDRPVTRGQFAALLHRAAGSPTAPPHGFADVVAPWQHDAVSWMTAEAITTGRSPSTFDPDAAISRAELAVMAHRLRGSPIVDLPVEDGPECRSRLFIHGTGDVNFDPNYGPNPQREFAYAWSGLDGLFLSDHLTIINLECVPSPFGSPVPKSFNFRCPTAALGPSADAGIDVASLANNHSRDYGAAALLDGIVNVRAAGIAPVGAGADLTEALQPVIVERNGWTIAVLGFNAINRSAPWVAAPGNPGTAPGDIATMTAAVRAADEIADLVFVTIHWGVEATFTPTAADRARGYALIDAGADAIFGHHPHRLQPLEHHQGRPIFWSLGNFVWQQRDRSRTTAVGRVVVEPDGSVVGSLLPVDIADKGHPDLLL